MLQNEGQITVEGGGDDHADSNGNHRTSNGSDALDDELDDSAASGANSQRNRARKSTQAETIEAN